MQHRRHFRPNMHDLLPSCSLLLHSLLLVSFITPGIFGVAVNGDGRLTKCRVKRQGVQAFAAAPTATAQGTSPVNDAPGATLSTTQALEASPSSAPVLPPFDYANQKIRGVNLGGWFMMEVSVPWRSKALLD
jgi:hypothetical protein